MEDPFWGLAASHVAAEIITRSFSLTVTGAMVLNEGVTFFKAPAPASSPPTVIVLINPVSVVIFKSNS